MARGGWGGEGEVVMEVVEVGVVRLVGVAVGGRKKVRKRLK
jgi:hypothetical protein